MESFENLIFYKLFRRDLPEVIVENNGMVFYPIEIAFQLQNGFLVFNEATFEFQEELHHAADFENITHQLEPADFYIIERVADEYMDSEIHLSNKQRLRILQFPVEYDHQLQSWLEITPSVESDRNASPNILYEASRSKPGLFKRLFSR